MTFLLSRTNVICQAFLACMIAFTSSSAAAGSPLEYGLAPPPPYGFEGTTPDACAPEAAAYAAVAGLAKTFAEKRLFTEALIDMQFQLHDCLDASEERDEEPAIPPLSDSTWL